MSKSASIWSRLAIFRLPRSAEKGQHFQTGGKKKTGAKAQPRYNGFRVISDRVITALQCTTYSVAPIHRGPLFREIQYIANRPWLPNFP